MPKTSENIFYSIQENEFFIISKIALDHGGASNTFQNFCGSFYNIQFKPYAASKMELFVTEKREWLETVIDCCYKELHLKSNSEIQYFIWCLHVQSWQKQMKKHQNNVSNIFKVKDATTTSVVSIGNFEHVLHFILLLLLLDLKK